MRQIDAQVWRQARQRLAVLGVGGLTLCAFAMCLFGGLRASRAGDVTAGPPDLVSQVRFSPLQEISPVNASRLKLVGRFHGNGLAAQGGAPLFADGAVELLTNFPHTLFALDPADASEAPKWEFTTPADHRARGLACCGRQEFGPVLDGSRIYFNTLDGRTVALDAANGSEIWQARPADPTNGESFASAPLVADGRVFVGNAGDAFGARGWIAALDADSGRELWRRFSTGPDADVGIGPGAMVGSKERGVTTWPPSGWEHGGGSVSGQLLYDPDRKLIFHGTGRAAPWNPDQRSGEDRWTSGLFAREAATGEVRWFIPLADGDPFARGATSASVLAEMKWKGVSRKLLLHADANGIVYVIDAGSGDVLAADVFAPTYATGDKAASAPKPPALSRNAITRDVCPAWIGATGAGIPAFSPQTGYLYIPVSHLCMDAEPRQANYIAGTPYLGMNVHVKQSASESQGSLLAWDVAARKPAWTVAEDYPVASGVLATAGGIVVYGTLDGAFKALDARNGQLLWRYGTGIGIIGQPASFQAQDGHQYLAVVAGGAGNAGLLAGGRPDPLDTTAALGLAQALRDLSAKDEASTLYLFRLR